jgi:hypothetical protein
MRTILLSFTLLITTAAFSQVQVNAPRSAGETLEHIKKESIGGKLDFGAKLDPKEMYVFEGVGYNHKDFGIFLWGQAVKRLGVESAKKAAALWEEINARVLTKPEKKALLRGFDAKSE